MKLFFLNQDTLHKIFSTIEKIPTYSTVKVFVEHQNQLFHNNRWAKQLKKLIEERNLNVTFVTDNAKQKDYYENNKLHYEFKEEDKRRRLLKLIYLFFFNVRKFHISIHQQKSYAFFAVFGAEIVFLLFVIYLLYSLILPKTTITITPSYQIDEIVYNFRYMQAEFIPDYPLPNTHIVVPYEYQDTVISKSLTIDGEKVQYTVLPAKGKVRIVNTTDTAFNLIKWTQIMTEDGLLFTLDSAISLAAWKWDGNAAYTYATATAKEEDTQGEFIGARGNIAANTRLIIKNLKQSKYTKDIYTESTENFAGGSVVKSGSITQTDIGVLQKKLYESIQLNLIPDIQKIVQSDRKNVLLPFKQLFVVSGCNYLGILDAEFIAQQTSLGWTLQCTVLYPAVKRTDMEYAIERYLEKRKSQIHTIVSVNPDSLHFIELFTGEYNSSIISTKINIIQGYDFLKDINGISASIKEKSIGLPKTKALQFILWYPEISRAEISISPPWYTTISNIKSRIFITTKSIHKENL